MKRVAIVTENGYLGQKIRLALAEKYEVLFVDADSGHDICFWDTDTAGGAPDGAVAMSRAERAELKLPFTYGSLYAVFDGRDVSLLTVASDARSCTLRGREIRLTELEGRLLSLLVSAGGEPVSREDILARVWGDSTDIGIINVYIHYLREKLEDGEKIILSSRGKGYGIDRKYLGGKSNA